MHIWFSISSEMNTVTLLESRQSYINPAMIQYSPTPSLTRPFRIPPSTLRTLHLCFNGLMEGHHIVDRRVGLVRVVFRARTPT